MSDQFLNFELPGNDEDLFVDDVKVRFVNSVKNGQYRLALTNLLSVLNILGDRVSELEAKLADVDNQVETPEQPTTPRKSRAQKAVDENDAEV